MTTHKRCEARVIRETIEEYVDLNGELTNVIFRLEELAKPYRNWDSVYLETSVESSYDGQIAKISLVASRRESTLEARNRINRDLDMTESAERAEYLRLKKKYGE